MHGNAENVGIESRPHGPKEHAKTRGFRMYATCIKKHLRKHTDRFVNKLCEQRLKI